MPEAGAGLVIVIEPEGEGEVQVELTEMVTSGEGLVLSANGTVKLLELLVQGPDLTILLKQSVKEAEEGTA